VDSPRTIALALAPPAEIDAPIGRHRHRRQADFPVILDLREHGVPDESSTGERNVPLPFVAGSADGDVSAPLLYADRGQEAGYETLARASLDVRGTVVLVRFGDESPAALVARAQAHGAAAVILYADPQDDGDARGLVAPNGPWRPAASVPRAWVGADVRIPTISISASNARVLLAALARGAARVHLVVKLDRKMATLWNTIGIVSGVHGDQSVVVGAKRDAWVFGAGDDGAGIATLVEIGRGLGYLLGARWRPQRTIVLAAWDGGEIGSAGAREYVRAHEREVRTGCFAYLDADRSASGPAFGANAVAPLAGGVIAASRSVRDPVATGSTVYERWAARAARGAPQPLPPSRDGDAGAFLDVGTPVAATAFRGPFGVDNSGYDTAAYAAAQSDPGFTLHRSAAQIEGTLALSLADADGSPYAVASFVRPLRDAIARLPAQTPALDAANLRRAVDRFAAAARAADASGTLSAARGLGAVRGLDLLVYGPSGSAPFPLPGLTRALATGDANVVAAALESVCAAVDRATAALGR
jgi:N-acetylated-alpha-linked acidic dipeptidase